MWTEAGADMDNRDAFYRQVGMRIRDKRRERGLSQEGLAAAVGLKRPSISNIEKGRQNILLHTFHEIAESLDVQAADLLPGRPIASSPMPDMRDYSKEVREFVEAGIKPVKSTGVPSHGDSTTED
jgi:transcriptional regulator with XRE-family HTH domain